MKLLKIVKLFIQNIYWNIKYVHILYTKYTIHVLDTSNIEKITEAKISDSVSNVIATAKRYPYDILDFINMCKQKGIVDIDKKVYEDMLVFAESVGVKKDDIASSLYLYTGAITAHQKQFESQVMGIISDINASTIEVTDDIKDKININNAKIKELTEMNTAYFNKMGSINKASTKRKNKLLKLLEYMTTISNSTLEDIKSAKTKLEL